MTEPQPQPPAPNQGAAPADAAPRTSPLQAAWRVLARFDPRKQRLDEALEQMLAKERKGQERDFPGLVTGLSDLALRAAPLFDHLINHVSTVQAGKLERSVRAAIHLGIAEYLRTGSAHHVVKRSVDLMPRTHKARGLVNAVLRRVTELASVRELSEPERQALAQGELAGLLDAQHAPLGGRWLLELASPLLPADTTAGLMLLAGIPEWLWRELDACLAPDELQHLALACAQAPGVWFRLTPGRESECAALFPPEQAGPARFATGADAGRALASKAFRSGALTVQDFSAQQPIDRWPPKPGQRCLDLCSAPGSKTLQLAYAVGPTGHVLAFDADEGRLRKVKQNLDRHGIKHVNGAFGDGRSVELPDLGEFDYVLLDAPCSNTGVMARRLEVKLRLTRDDLTSLAALQRALLENAARHCAPGGVLVYSTCSLLDAENGALVRAFLDAEGGDDSGWQMLDEELTLPVAGSHDGGYYCVLRTPE